MKWHTAIIRTVLVSTLVVAGSVALASAPATAQELPLEKKIELLTKNKDQIGTGDMLRRFFFGDLLPIAVQPGGAGMVVNLYNKANDYTFAFCTTYDVVIAIKKGRVTQFAPQEVK
jgi:hypothetical protein